MANKDNILAAIREAAAKLEAQGVTPSTAAKGYAIEAEGLLAILGELSMEDLRRKAGS
jgi:Na+/H+-translocating membrane pyrophosphatase